MSSALLGLLLAANCGSGVDVRVGADKTLDVEAKGASVSSVLECLADKVGFKLVMAPGAALRQPVTLTLRRRTSAQSVIGVLDGLAIDYAFASDASGSRILMLLITGRSGSAAASGSPSGGSSAGPPAFRRPPTAATPPAPEEGAETDNNPPPDFAVPFQPPPAVAAPFQPPLFPEARPLTPLSLRDARQIHVAYSKTPSPAPGSQPSQRPPPARDD